MKHKFLVPVFWLTLAVPALAEKISLAEISRYLNALTTAEAGFIQTSADGSRASGKVYIHRPNRMRFEYAPPEEALVLASAGKVAIFDSKSNQPPEEYPLRRTPLNLILGRNIDLARARMVVAHEDMGNATAVVVQDPEHPEYGTLRMIFTANPTALREWVTVDQDGFETRIALSELRTGMSFPPSLFSITFERDRRGGN